MARAGAPAEPPTGRVAVLRREVLSDSCERGWSESRHLSLPLCSSDNLTSSLGNPSAHCTPSRNLRSRRRPRNRWRCQNSSWPRSSVGASGGREALAGEVCHGGAAASTTAAARRVGFIKVLEAIDASRPAKNLPSARPRAGSPLRLHFRTQIRPGRPHQGSR